MMIPQNLAAHVGTFLQQTGYALLPGLLSADDCADLIALYDRPEPFRKTIVMERFRFGRGEYKYFHYPLPEPVQHLRQTLYPALVPVANNWMAALRQPIRYPDTLTEFQALCAGRGQTKPTPLLLRYESGGYNALHQDLYGAVFFPFQVVVLLNEPGRDFTGGEFVLVEQRPRAQSKAIVLSPKQGDAVVFTTNFRPVEGSRGRYRVSMKHGVSEVLTGHRNTLGIIFHEAA